jgi:class 3 adenylate cyclase
MSEEIPFTVVLDNEQRVVSVSDAAGRPVSIEAKNPAFCAFLNWYCRQTAIKASNLAKLEIDDFFAHSISTAIDYCKTSGAMLFYANRSFEGIQVNLSFPPANGNGDGPYVRFYRLQQSAAAGKYSAAAFSDASIHPVVASLCVTEEVMSEMHRMLAEQGAGELQNIWSIPVERTFVYFDVSDFSKYPAGQQALIINVITVLSSRTSRWPIAIEDVREKCERRMCIGDGYIFVFTKAAHAASFAAYLACRVERLIADRNLMEFHFRVGIHTGPVYRFWDGGDWNYVGTGINDARRILEAIGTKQDDVVFMSHETRQEIARTQASQSVLNPVYNYLQNRGRRADKHGVLRRVYEVNHTAWLGGMMPRTGAGSL